MIVTEQQIRAQTPLADQLLTRLHEDTDGMCDRAEVVRVIATFLAENDSGAARASMGRMYAALNQVATDMQGISNISDEKFVIEIAGNVANYAAAARRPV